MKKNYLLFIAFVLFLFAGCNNETELQSVSSPDDTGQVAYDVSENLARKVANKFTGNKDDETRGASSRVIKEIYSIPGSDGNAAMYVINYAGNAGYVLVSATKKYTPILAYSDDGNFSVSSDMPYGLTQWMDETKAVVNYQKYDATDTAVQKYIQSWKKYEDILFATTTRTDIDRLLMDEVNYWYGQGYDVYDISSIPSIDATANFPAYAEASIYPLYDYQIYSLVLSKEQTIVDTYGPLLTTKWTQGIPYNNALSELGYSSLYPLGCCAVALGQVMAYHKYPNNYNWTRILANNGYNIETQQYLKDVALSINTTFGINGSSSNMTNVRDALVRTFGYSTKASIVNSASLSSSQLPVIIRADEDNAAVGHEWVCDGRETMRHYYEYLLRVPTIENEYHTIMNRQTDDYMITLFHMNWGWGGSHDGWYVNNDNIIIRNPTNSNIVYNFKNKQYLINIQKP